MSSLKGAKPRMRKKLWSQQVRETNPNYDTQKTTAYIFGGKRRFVHKRSPYS